MASIGVHGAGASSGGGGTTDATIVAPIGQDTMDNSVSVVLASDQTPVPVTIADGADVALGTTTDAAETSDSSGTVIGFLRGLVKWAYERMPASLGQATMANSLPVVLASDQSIISTAIPTITATDTLSGTGNVPITLDGHTGVGVWLDPNATFAGTILVEATTDGVTWFFIRFVNVAQGSVAAGVTYVGGLADGFADQHLSAILPSGIISVRARVSAYTAGSITILIVASSSQELTPPYTGANAVTPAPTSGLQIGGSATAGGQFNTVRATTSHAGLSDQGLVVRPVGMMLTAGSSAGSLQTTLVGGRDPETNALRQLDLLAKNINSSGYQRLLVQAYPTTDGTTLMPLMAAHASRGFVEPTKATAGSAPAAATVGVTSAQAVAANASRKGLILTNTSPNVISLSFDAAAVLNSGITLLPGATFSMDENSFDAGEVRAIASVASSNLSVQEFT